MIDGVVRLVLGITAAAVVALALYTGTNYGGGRPRFRDTHPLLFWGFVILLWTSAVAFVASGTIDLIR